MKTFILLLLFSANCFAVGGSVDQKRNLYSVTSVTTAAYVTMIASTSSVVSKVEIFDSSGQTLQLAVGQVGQEVVKMIIFPGGNGMVDLNILKGSRISLKALSANATSGEIDINLYN